MHEKVSTQYDAAGNEVATFWRPVRPADDGASPFARIKRIALDCRPSEVPAALAAIVRICIDAERAAAMPALQPDENRARIDATGESAP